MPRTPTTAIPASSSASSAAVSSDSVGSDAASGPQRVSSEKRYQFLLGQSKLFEYFIDAKRGGKSPLDALSKQDDERGGDVETDGDARHHRKSEKEEDRELLEETAEIPPFAFTTSPGYVEGGQLRAYQTQGVNWLISLYEHGINGILADEMGLGKTLQTLAFLGYLVFHRGIKGPFLLVVPKSTLQNWLNETRKWVPKLRAFVLHGDKETRNQLIKEKLSDTSQWDAVITSYEVCLMEKSAIRKISWEYLVIDEAHRIKNEHSMLAQIVRGFQSNARLLVTGTPLQNNLHELWALLNYLLPDIFSSSDDFDAWFRDHGEQDQDHMLHHLKALLQPFLLRRLKADVEHSLLPKKEVNLYVGMSDLQRKWYKRILERDIEAVNGLTRGREGSTRLLNIVMQLRKACNHPYLFDGAEPGPPFTTDQHLVDAAGKMIVLDQLLTRLKATGSRVLLFSQMSRMLDILEDYCGWRGFEYCRIDGQTAHEDRISAIDEFNAPNSSKFVFLLTTRAGGLGINLATADIVILYDSDWNPQVDLQAQDRAHRIGQTKQVVVFRLLTEGSLEEKIIERAMQKLRLDQLVIQQGKVVNANRPLGREEMLSMIRHGAELVLHGEAASNTEMSGIEELLKKGEERTRGLQERFKNTALEDLLSGAATSTLEDQLSAPISQPMQSRFIELAKRERKSGMYIVDEYYREALRVHPKSDKPSRAPVPKAFVIHDHQFFPEEIKPLLDRSILLYQKGHGVRLGEVDIADTKERAARQKAIDTVQPLTKEEEKRRDALYAQGFPNWSKKDLQLFVRACERYGRPAIEGIAGDLEGGKTAVEVREYSKVFWRRIGELADGTRIKTAVERGEARLEKAAAQMRSITRFLSKQPKSSLLTINYYGSKSKNYTQLEDAFIVRALEGRNPSDLVTFEEVAREIGQEPMFRFDWFIRTRSPTELQQRATRLIGFIEREVREADARKPVRSKSGKKRGGKVSGSVSKKSKL